MNEIQIFNNPQFGEIRATSNENNEPLFCATDVCKALGYANGRDAIAKHVSEDDVAKRDIIDNLGRTQSASFVNESGLYSLIFGSKLDSAKAFKKWVTSEVLPSIRKTGGYIAAKADDTPEIIMARAILVAQDTIKKQSLRIEEQKRKIAEDAPKVLYADSTAASKTSCLVGEMAKILTQNGYEIGQNRLFKKLREEGYLGKTGEYYNVPNQRYQEMGLFEVKKSIINNPDGSTFQKSTTKITGKGQIYFVNKFLGPKTQV